MPTLITSARYRASVETLYAVHTDAHNMERLSSFPGRFRLVSASVPSREGDVQVFRLGIWPFTRRWQARIELLDPGHSLTDVQEAGPFHAWRHSHVVFSNGAGSVLLDYVEFSTGMSIAARLFDRLIMLPALRLSFAQRYRALRRLLHE